MSVQRGDVIIVELISNSSVYDERRKEIMGLSVIACVLEVLGRDGMALIMEGKMVQMLGIE